MSNNGHISYLKVEYGFVTPQSTYLSPSSCLRAATSLADLFHPVPVGGHHGKKVGRNKTEVPTTASRQ
jgi:hypothetical protein